jgi:hypothetical protein
MTTGTRYFVPVCLYPHTKYRTNDGVTDLFEKYQFQCHDHLIVIADHLLALDNLVTGRYWSTDTVFDKARREAKQIFNLINRISHKFRAQERGRIVYWDEIGGTEQFTEFAKHMRNGFMADKLLSTALDEFVSRRVSRFGLGSSPDREHKHEQEYLLSEVCMSVFCTEVLHYQVEIWERPPAPDVPDPLKLLYNNRPEVIALVTGHPATRLLEFLYDASSAP